MARLLAIDYGKKRTGLAVSDEMQIIAGGLTTVPTTELIDFISIEEGTKAWVDYIEEINLNTKRKTMKRSFYNEGYKGYRYRHNS